MIAYIRKNGSVIGNFNADIGKSDGRRAMADAVLEYIRIISTKLGQLSGILNRISGKVAVAEPYQLPPDWNTLVEIGKLALNSGISLEFGNPSSKGSRKRIKGLVPDGQCLN
ncbi:hypothetical protein ACFO4N_12210 [Camelliibacillus cellulosilyticus]|uniref:Uncharacterized protein n=1 Tax=Camelliibacillus cellulosilyticus TaxID=2174486 RepID=A0ABV9GQ98_9BACL